MEKPIVLDASTLVADIQDEPGAAVARKYMNHGYPHRNLFMHVVNICEVAYHSIKAGYSEQDAFKMAKPKGIIPVDEFGPQM